MKKILIIPIICILALVAVLTSCGKKATEYGDITLIGSDKALIKFNYECMYSDSRSVFIKVNGVRASNLITNRTPYPGGGYNTNGLNYPDFLVEDPGAKEISVILPHKIDNGTDSIELYKTTVQLEAGKKYSFNIADVSPNTKSVLVNEDFTLPAIGYTRLHFVNLMPNVPAIDLYYGTATTTDQSSDSLVVANVPYMGVSPDFTMHTVSKTWKIRAAGAAKTSATVIASYTSSSTVASQRVLTAFATGYSGLTTSAQKPYIAFFLVR